MSANTAAQFWVHDSLSQPLMDLLVERTRRGVKPTIVGIGELPDFHKLNPHWCDRVYSMTELQ